MLVKSLQSLEIGIANRLVEREETLEQSFRTGENRSPLNLEVLGLRASHLIMSAVVSVAEILIPRSTE